MKTITLLDGEHVLSPPTFYALTLMDEWDVDIDFRPKNIAGILAALLTDVEPFKDGEPVRVWTTAEVAKLIPAKGIESIIEAIGDLMEEGFPQLKGDTERPT